MFKQSIFTFIVGCLTLVFVSLSFMSAADASVPRQSKHFVKAKHKKKINQKKIKRSEHKKYERTISSVKKKASSKRSRKVSSKIDFPRAPAKPSFMSLKTGSKKARSKNINPQEGEAFRYLGNEGRGMYRVHGDPASLESLEDDS